MIKKKLQIVKTLTDNYREADTLAELKELLQQIVAPKVSKIHIPISDKQGVDFVKIKDILYIKADSNYSIINLCDGSTKMVSKSLIHYEKELINNDFLRIHSSYLINKQKLTRLNRSSKPSLTLEGDVRLPISRSRKDLIIKQLL